MSIGPDPLGKMFPFGSGIAPVMAELVVPGWVRLPSPLEADLHRRFAAWRRERGTLALAVLHLRGYVSLDPEPRCALSLKADDDCSQNTRALPSGSRNIACVPLESSVGGRSKKTPLALSSS
jgi:hypothetical protein